MKQTRVPRNIDIKYVGKAPQTHTIRCRACNKEDVVSLRYTRNCNACRNSAWYNAAVRESDQWSGWQHDAYVGQTTQRVVRTPPKKPEEE